MIKRAFAAIAVLCAAVVVFTTQPQRVAATPPTITYGPTTFTSNGTMPVCDLTGQNTITMTLSGVSGVVNAAPYQSLNGGATWRILSTVGAQTANGTYTGSIGPTETNFFVVVQVSAGASVTVTESCYFATPPPTPTPSPTPTPTPTPGPTPTPTPTPPPTPTPTPVPVNCVLGCAAGSTPIPYATAPGTLLQVQVTNSTPVPGLTPIPWSTGSPQPVNCVAGCATPIPFPSAFFVTGAFPTPIPFPSAFYVTGAFPTPIGWSTASPEPVAIVSPVLPTPIPWSTGSPAPVNCVSGCATPIPFPSAFYVTGAFPTPIPFPTLGVNLLNTPAVTISGPVTVNTTASPNATWSPYPGALSQLAGPSTAPAASGGQYLACVNSAGQLCVTTPAPCSTATCATAVYQGTNPWTVNTAAPVTSVSANIGTPTVVPSCPAASYPCGLPTPSTTASPPGGGYIVPTLTPTYAVLGCSNNGPGSVATTANVIPVGCGPGVGYGVTPNGASLPVNLCTTGNVSSAQNNCYPAPVPTPSAGTNGALAFAVPVQVPCIFPSGSPQNLTAGNYGFLACDATGALKVTTPAPVATVNVANLPTAAPTLGPEATPGAVVPAAAQNYVLGAGGTAWVPRCSAPSPAPSGIAATGFNSSGCAAGPITDGGCLINQGTASNQNCVTGVAGKRIYVTAVTGTCNGTPGTTLCYLLYGTNSLCSSGATDFVIWNSAPTSGATPTSINLASSAGLWIIPAGDYLCVGGLNGTGLFEGSLLYTQAPFRAIVFHRYQLLNGWHTVKPIMETKP